MIQDSLLHLLLMLLIACVSILGDKGLQNGRTEIVRALSDNLTHATVGGLSWTLVVLLSQKPVLECLRSISACFFLASLIDVDHFITAGSWDINDATHLHHRPFLHCTTIPVTLWMMMSMIARLVEAPEVIAYAHMILISFLSHHVRDGNRRGLWLWPFGSTPPIPYLCYLSVSVSLPYLIFWVMQWQMPKHTQSLSFIV